MKKIGYLFIIVFSLLIISSCKKENLVLELETDNIILNVGEEYNIKANVTGLKKYELIYSTNNTEIIDLVDNKIIAKKSGTASVVVSVDGKDLAKTLKVEIKEVFVPSLTIEKTSYELEIGENVTLNPVTNVTSENPFVVSANKEGIVTVEGLKVVAQASGEVELTISLKDYPEVSCKVVITVKEAFVPSLTIEKTSYELEIGENVTLNPVTNVTGENPFVVSANKEGIVIVDGLKVIAQASGEVELTISLKDYSEVSCKVVITVKEAFVPSLTIEKTSYELGIGENVTLNPVTNVTSENPFVVSANKEGIVIVDGLKVIAQASGEVELTISLKDYPEIAIVLIVTVIEPIDDTIEPEILLEGVTTSDTISWGKTFDPLKGVKAIDDIDGDITNKIKVTGSVDNQTCGKYELLYEVSDDKGNLASLTRTIEVIWDYTVEFIGHSGCYYGVANSEAAFLYAASVLKYQAIECDLKQTSDGVFVMCHDDTFGGYTLANTPWSTIKDVEVTSKRTAGYPSQYGETVGTYTSKICTLERYLEICKEYNAKAVIELKGSPGISSSDQSRMPALMEVIKKMDMLDQVIFLGSAYNCLIWVKENGYSYIPCQYLVNSCESNSVLNRCIEYGFDLSINVTGNYSNSAEWIAKYQAAGCKVSTWTFTQYVDYKEIQKWIDLGVEYVTTDWHRMDKLNLTTYDELVKYNVTFKGSDGSILKEVEVVEGRTAPAPVVEVPKGYQFIGWDQEIINVTSDLVVTAKYELIEYSIKYMENLYTFQEGTWASKSEFVNEFYSDLFNWITKNANSIEGLSVNNGVYTLKINDTEYGTAVFASSSDMLNLNPYVVERTLGTLIYKPIPGENSSTYVPVIDEAYFLNSEPYRTKYINMNAYFLNAIINAYPTYNQRYYQNTNNRVQIFFRFHQWCNGTTIAAFNSYPTKFTIKYLVGVEATMPTTLLTYTINDEFDLPNPIASIEFLGWYLDVDDESTKVTKIVKGSTGDLVLYAKWEKVDIPDVYSEVAYELNGGTNNVNNPSEYLEGISHSLYEPTRDGYKFIGWSSDEDGTNIISSISETTTGKITLYANWDYQTYTVSYELLEGSWGNEVVFSGNATTSIVSTSKSDFWGGYKNNIYLFNKTDGITNATYSFRVGIAMDITKGTYVVKNVAKSGESFNSTGIDFVIVISGDYSSYASTSTFRNSVKVGQCVRFTGDPATGSATIEFFEASNVSGGTIDNYVTEYTINNLPLLLPTPICDGKTFKGWSLNSDLSGELITSINEGTFGNLILYAVFE